MVDRVEAIIAKELATDEMLLTGLGFATDVMLLTSLGFATDVMLLTGPGLVTGTMSNNTQPTFICYGT